MAKLRCKPHKMWLTDSDVSGNVVDEGAATGAAVGITVSATFKHAKGPVTYSLSDDAGGAFTIDPLTGVVTVANGALLDYETAQSQTITVVATDGKVFGAKSFEVSIRNVAEVERVSVASDGTQGNADSIGSAISTDGRYVAYDSFASNLVPGDTNGLLDVFVLDRQTDIVERVSVASDGTEGNWTSSSPSISADGRYVAFESDASNLVPGDTNGTDVFVFDRQTDTVERVSVASDGTQANGFSSSSSISADGRYVAYVSGASNLVPGDTNFVEDIFVFDRQTDTVERVSVASDGTQANGESFQPSISADGRYVAYVSFASNLVPGDTNGTDIFVFDRQTDTVERISVPIDDTEWNGTSSSPSISADGRYVAFESQASNLVPGDTNGFVVDAFVFDRQTDTMERVSVAEDGAEGNNHSSSPSISADGRYVVYHSFASNLVPGDTNDLVDAFVFDRQTDTVKRVSVADDGTAGNSYSSSPSISADGQYVAYRSDASNLVSGDTNGVGDVFVASTYDFLI